MKEEWLFQGAVVPVDVETTAALVTEIKRLIDVVGGMALAQPEQQAEPPEWPLIKNILDEYGLQAIAFVAEWKKTQQQAEPICPECKAAVLYECVACSSNNYPPAAQRPWVGLTDDEIKEIVGPYGDTPIKGYTRKLFDQIEAKLKEKNT